MTQMFQALVLLVVGLIVGMVGSKIIAPEPTCITIDYVYCHTGKTVSFCINKHNTCFCIRAKIWLRRRSIILVVQLEVWILCGMKV